MTESDLQGGPGSGEAEPLPFAAPFHQLSTDMPFSWLRKGWADFRRAPKQSLGYGIIIVILSWIVTGIGLKVGSYWSVLILLSGFVFVAPVLAMGLYSISRQLERASSLRSAAAWSRSARHWVTRWCLHWRCWCCFWCGRARVPWCTCFSRQRCDGCLEAGTVPRHRLGGRLHFCIADIRVQRVFPADDLRSPGRCHHCHRHQRQCRAAQQAGDDGVGAADRGLTAIGFVTALLGLAVTIPVLGHATWHAYRDTIDAARGRRTIHRAGAESCIKKGLTALFYAAAASCRIDVPRQRRNCAGTAFSISFSASLTSGDSRGFSGRSPFISAFQTMRPEAVSWMAIAGSRHSGR